MDDKIISLTYALKSAIENNELIKELDNIENDMNNSEEVMALSYRKDVALSEYNDALNHFGENSEISSQKQKLLYESKKNLDSHPLVRKYLSLYSDVRIMYEQLNGILFDFMKEKICGKSNL